jgi:hypothetical protein
MLQPTKPYYTSTSQQLTRSCHHRPPPEQCALSTAAHATPQCCGGHTSPCQPQPRTVHAHHSKSKPLLQASFPAAPLLPLHAPHCDSVCSQAQSPDHMLLRHTTTWHTPPCTHTPSSQHTRTHTHTPASLHARALHRLHTASCKTQPSAAATYIPPQRWQQPPLAPPLYGAHTQKPPPHQGVCASTYEAAAAASHAALAAAKRRPLPVSPPDQAACPSPAAAAAS